MVKWVQAIYTNGEVILCENLCSELEDKILQIMIFESSEFDEKIDYSESKINQFLERVKNYSFQLPPDYKFNREEIYDR